jgi:hypothetical protein
MMSFLGKVDFLVIMLGRYYAIGYMALFAGFLAGSIIAFLPLMALLLAAKVVTRERVRRTVGITILSVLGVIWLGAFLWGMANCGFKAGSFLYGEWGNTVPLYAENGSSGTYILRDGSVVHGFTIGDRFFFYPGAAVPLYFIIKYFRRSMKWFDDTKKRVEQLTSKWIV